jgi:RNA polymerase sigma-70 factor (ECF subfamily)
MKVLIVSSQDTTEKLLKQAQAGDRAAFDEIVERFRARLAVFVERRLGPQVRRTIGVDDVLQETFVKAVTSIERLEWRGEDSLFCWLATIAEHRIRRLARPIRGAAEVPLNRDLSDHAASPSRVMRREERFERLDGALAALSPDHREVIRLARLQGLPIKDVAHQMNRSSGAVRHLLLRALASLRASFGEGTESFHLPARSLGDSAADSDE